MREGILLEDALEEIEKRVKRIVDTKKVEVREAGGFCLAEDVYAGIDNPPFSRSPVDGYAVRAEDIRGAVRGNPARLQVAGCIYAGDDGQSFQAKPGEAYRIMTGAPFRRERIRRLSRKIRIMARMWWKSTRARSHGIITVFRERITKKRAFF